MSDPTEEAAPGRRDHDDYDSDQEALLILYRELKSDMREYSRRWNRRITRGSAIVVLIVGYAVAEEPIVMTVAPFAILLFLIAHAMGENNVARISSQISRIELLIDTEGFDFENQFSIYSDDFRTRERQIPIVVMNGFIGFVYFLTMALGLRIVAMEYGFLSVEMLVIATFYLVIVLVAALLFLTNKRIYEREAEVIEELRESTPSDDR